MTSLFGIVLAAAGVIGLAHGSEVRLRGGTDLGAPVLEVEATPSATLLLRSRSWDLSLGYAPRLTLRQLDVSGAFEALQTGTLGLSWHGRRTVLSVHGDATYGTQRFTSLDLQSALPEGSSSIQRLPAAVPLAYMSARGGAIVTHTPAPRWALDGAFEYSVAGGTDAASRAVVPLQSGPHGALGATYSLTRIDHLATALDASYALFSSGPEATVGLATETWRRALSRRTDSSFGLGIAGTISRDGSAAEPRYGAYPVAEAALSHRAPDRLDARFSLALAPVVDRLSGRVDERLQGAAAATWSFAPRLGVRARISAAQTVPWSEDDAVTLVLGEAAISARVSDRLQLEVGTRGASQEPGGAFQWVFFTVATVTVQPLRF